MVFLPVLLVASPAIAQRAVHYRHSVDSMAPGEIGRRQLVRGGPLEGYYQPVEISVPRGASISMARDGAFVAPRPGSVKVGMLIGHVYRFKVAGIPRHEGLEVYPTVEVIDRLYPPPGLCEKFPIPLQLTEEELVYALNGNFVTRVIYLEDPQSALPIAELPGNQRVFEVARRDDPLRIADELGRPMAILRMGSRIPEPEGPSGRFTFGMPPFLEYERPAAVVPRGSGLEPPAPGAERVRNYPRLPVTTGRHPSYPAIHR